MTAKATDTTTANQSTDRDLAEIETFIRELVREEGIPVTTTTEVAEEFGLSMRVARRRLFMLEGRGVIARKGSTAYFWYVDGAPLVDD